VMKKGPASEGENARGSSKKRNHQGCKGEEKKKKNPYTNVKKAPVVATSRDCVRGELAVKNEKK